MKNSILTILLIFFFQGYFSQKTKPKSEQKTKIIFNQKLADSLGADKMGMKNYMLVILKTGPKDAEITDKNQRAELFKGHFANINALADSGKLISAGPFSTKNALQYRGLFIFDVKTEEEAKQLVEKDPTVKAGIFNYEIFPWYGSAALPMHLKYHKIISKEKP